MLNGKGKSESSERMRSSRKCNVHRCQGGWKDDGRVVGVGSKSDYGLGGRPKNLPTTYVPGDKNRAHPDGFGKGPYDKDILDGKLKPVD